MKMSWKSTNSGKGREPLVTIEIKGARALHDAISEGILKAMSQEMQDLVEEMTRAAFTLSVHWEHDGRLRYESSFTNVSAQPRGQPEPLQAVELTECPICHVHYVATPERERHCEAPKLLGAAPLT